MMGCKNLIRSVIGLGILIALAGCTPEQEEATVTASPVVVTQTIEVDEQATHRANVVATLEAQVTNTAAAATPTATVPTLAITPTALPTAEVPLTEDGPWLMFMALDSAERIQLWAVNADGSGLKQLTDFTDRDVVRFEVNPHPLSDGSIQIAYTTVLQPDQIAFLHLMQLPGGTTYEVTHLTPALSEKIPTYEFNTIFPYERLSAVTSMPGALRWSPDGRQLAFVGAIHGQTSDVYTYTPSTGEIVRLTDGPTLAWNLLWSPDGRYIVHTGNFWFGGSGSRYSDGCVWAARADGSGVTSLPGRGALYIGWLAPDTLLLYTGPDMVCTEDLRTVNVDSGIAYHIIPGCFGSVAYDINNNIALITYSESPLEVDVENIDNPLEESGTYLLKDGQFEFLSADIENVYWSSEQQTFYGRDSQWRGYEIFPEEGKIVALDAPTNAVPILSPDGQYQAWSRTSKGYAMSLPLFGQTSNPEHLGLWIETPDGEYIQVKTRSTGAEYVMWASDSKHIFFISDEIGYIAAAPDFIPQRLPIDIPLYASYWQFEWVP